MRCKNLHPIDEKVPNLGQAHLSLDQTLKTWRIFRGEDCLTAFTKLLCEVLAHQTGPQWHGSKSAGVTRRHQASPGVTRRFMGHVLAYLRIAELEEPSAGTSHGNRLNQAAKLQHGHMTWVTPRLIGIPLASYEGLAAQVWHGRNGSLLVHTPAYYEVLQLLNCLNSLTHWFLDAWEYPTAT